MFKKDNLLLGLILGIIMPVIGCLAYLFFLWGYGNATMGSTHKPFFDFIKPIFMGNKSSIVSVSVIANLPFFYLYLNQEKFITVRGIVLATIIYSVVVLFLFWIL